MLWFCLTSSIVFSSDDWPRIVCFNVRLKSNEALRDAFELAPVGSEFVINRYRDASQNLRTTMLKIIRRAGLEPWERVFQNLRASRQTELNQQHPAHVVCDWMGNSEAVANEHYLHTTDADFDRALSTTCTALQNPVQCVTVRRPAGDSSPHTPCAEPSAHGVCRLRSGKLFPAARLRTKIARKSIHRIPSDAASQRPARETRRSVIEPLRGSTFSGVGNLSPEDVQPWKGRTTFKQQPHAKGSRIL